MEGQNLGKAGQEELLRASLLRALLTPPVGNLKGAGSLDNRIRNRLLGTGRDDRELNHGIPMVIHVITVITLDDIGDLEAEELVQEGDLVTQKLEELMRVTDVLTGGHGR